MSRDYFKTRRHSGLTGYRLVPVLSRISFHGRRFWMLRRSLITRMTNTGDFEFSKKSRGQALITLIFFVLISVTIASGAIIMIAVNSASLSKLEVGNISYYVAEAGIENAILRVIRDPIYTGETLTIDNATVLITVTGSNPKTITSTATNGNFKRTVEAQMTLASGYYTLSGWKEI